MFPYQLSLPEEADVSIEALLTRVCPAHPGTTLDYGVCEMCELDERLAKGYSEPITSPWVRKAAESSLPTKVYR